MYTEDSFFTLTTAGQIGLAALTLLLSVLMIVMARRLTRGFGFPIRCVVAIVLFWAFVWFSPQIYYLYYLQLFDGLPVQNVIHSPPAPNEIVRLISFTERATLAEHGKGVLAWLLLIAAVWPNSSRDIGGKTE